MKSNNKAKSVEQLAIDLGFKNVSDAPFWIQELIYTLINNGWTKEKSNE